MPSRQAVRAGRVVAAMIRRHVLLLTGLVSGCSLIVPGPDDFTYSGADSGLDGSVEADAGADAGEGLDASNDDGGGALDAGAACGPCPAERPICASDGSCVACISSGDCDDGDHCTTDRCGLDRTCSSTPSPLCIAEVVCGDYHTCARREGRVYCWGSASVGQLGTGATSGYEPTPVRIDSLANVGGMATTIDHTCATHDAGQVSCWGENAAQQVADTASASEPAPVLVSGLNNVLEVAPGSEHTCALRADGRVLCWGSNANQQLGDRPVMMSGMALEVPGLAGVVQVRAGSSSTCARLMDGTVECWGSRGYGLLGDGGGITGSTGVPVPVAGLDDAVDIAVGTVHACALRDSGQMVCWGFGTSGGLGDGSFAHSGVPTTVVDTTGSGQLTGVVEMALGRFHSCARRSDGEVLCWGSGDSGQNGQTADSAVPLEVAGLGPVARLAAGGRHSCAVTVDGGSVYCWGRNGTGQLGDGTTTSEPQPSPRPVMGL